MTGPVLVVRSEFALVEVSLVKRGANEVLRIRDVPGDTEIVLDALELEGLCSFGPELATRLRDPEWRMTDDPEREETWHKNSE